MSIFSRPRKFLGLAGGRRKKYLNPDADKKIWLADFFVGKRSFVSAFKGILEVHGVGQYRTAGLTLLLIMPRP